MKKLVFFFLLFSGLFVRAQVPQKIKTWYDYNLAHFDSIAIPKDTVSVPPSLKSWSFIATKNDLLYIWSPTLDKWITAGGPGSSDGNNFPNSLSAINGTILMGRNGLSSLSATASGNWNINAATVTNGVYTNGSYSNPAWITDIPFSKVNLRPNTLLGYGINDGVPNARTISINGISYDLSADRAWTISGGGGGTSGIDSVLLLNQLLTANRTMDINGHTFTINNNSGGIYNTIFGYSGAALKGYSEMNVGLWGISKDYAGVTGETQGTNSSGGVQAIANIAGNAVHTGLLINRINSSGLGADGIGVAIDFTNETSTGDAGAVSNRIVSKWNVANNSTRTSWLDLMGRNSAAEETFMNIQPGGIVRVNNNADTLASRAYARGFGGGGGGGTNNANAGSYYRVLKPGTQELKTLFPRNGIKIDSAINDVLGFRLHNIYVDPADSTVSINTTVVTGDKLRIVGPVRFDLGGDDYGDLYMRDSLGSLTRIPRPVVAGVKKVLTWRDNIWQPIEDSTGSGGISGISIRKNSTGSTFTRGRINLIEGTNVTMTVADDSGNDEIDVTINSSGGGGLSGLTSGRIPFTTSATTIADDATMTWDNTNKRFGLRVSAPDATFHIKSAGTTNSIGAIFQPGASDAYATMWNSVNNAATWGEVTGLGDFNFAKFSTNSFNVGDGPLASIRSQIRGSVDRPIGLFLRAYSDADYALIVSNSAGSTNNLTIKGNGDIYSKMLDDGSSTAKVVTVNNGVPAVGPVVSSGTYTPTLTNNANISSSTAYACQYMRVGNTVTVSGKVDITPTAGTTLTQLIMTLPVSSSFTQDYQAGGTGYFQNGSVNAAAKIFSNTSATTVSLVFYPSNTAVAPFFFSYTYQIL